MKLLIDDNISWRVTKSLVDDFDQVNHVSNCNIGNPAKDINIWK